MLFSQRTGKVPAKTFIQIETIDKDLATRLWNIISEHFLQVRWGHSQYTTERILAGFLKQIWRDFFNYNLDEIPVDVNRRVNAYAITDHLKEWYFIKSLWYEKYDLVEFIISLDGNTQKEFLISKCNVALEKEVAGYRIVDSVILQTTSLEEVDSIKTAISNTYDLIPVSIHLKTALGLLADKDNPDYRNSIKESISAVEALCKKIVNNDFTTLGKALVEIEKKHPLHGALKTAFSALYGYTSDAGGIRHSLLDNTLPIGFEDAKLMLVTCSAFINYLRVKANT